MKFTSATIYIYLLLKLPAAFFTGIRMQSISSKSAVITVKHRWINQNPFKSMFWAVQGMAAEFSTGILMSKGVRDSGEKVSMLITNINATFTKKATGKILFECHQGKTIKEVIQKAIETRESQKIILFSEGFNEERISVSKFQFEWSIKVKS